jgi:hypothetical protein
MSDKKMKDYSILQQAWRDTLGVFEAREHIGSGQTEGNRSDIPYRPCLLGWIGVRAVLAPSGVPTSVDIVLLKQSKIQSPYYVCDEHTSFWVARPHGYRVAERQNPEAYHRRSR